MDSCHVWAGTTRDPLLFSFVPNLVWLLRSLAPYSDNHHAAAPRPVHRTLQEVAVDRYRTVTPTVAADRVATALTRLAPVDGLAVAPENLGFDITDQIVNLVE